MRQSRAAQDFALYPLFYAAKWFVYATHFLFISFVATTHVEVYYTFVHPKLCSLQNKQYTWRIATKRGVDSKTWHK